MNPLLNKLRWIARRSGKEAELRDELEFHLEQEAAEAAVAGLRQLLSESLLLASIGGLLALGCGRLWLSDAPVALQVVESDSCWRTAREANVLLGRVGQPFWQHES